MRESVDRALSDGFSAFYGDATEEETLRRAGVHKAESVLVAPGRDDTAVLICLTVNDIEPDVNLVAAGMEEENLKLLYQAGADRVIAPAVMGGRLMAAAAETQSVPWYVEQVIGQRLVRPQGTPGRAARSWQADPGAARPARCAGASVYPALPT